MTLNKETSNVEFENKFCCVCVYTKLEMLIMTCMKSNLLMFES